MTYTYVIGKNPTSEDFKALCKRIGELYPKYEQRDGTKYTDGAENARWEKGEYAITAELAAASAMMTVTSDEALPELENEYCLKDEERRMHERRFFYIIFMGSSARVKFLFIPVLICVVFAVCASIYCHSSGTSMNRYDLEFFYIILLQFLVMSLGWNRWLIPVGLAVIWSARFKNHVIIKLLTAALPVLSIVYGCIFYDFEYALRAFFYGLRKFPNEVFEVLPVLYMAALPYLAIDEIACHRLLKLTGERPSKKVSVICPALSFVISAAVPVAFLIAEGRFYW